MINSGGRNVKIREKDISLLCKITREIFMEQPVFLELEAPIKICGKLPFQDVHFDDYDELTAHVYHSTWPD